MTSHIRSSLWRGLSREPALDDITRMLGAPEDTGCGIGGVELLAFRNKSIQVSLKDGHILLVALYFRPGCQTARWPEALKVAATLSGEMTEVEVQRWLTDRSLPWTRKLVAGEAMLEAGGEALFFFEDDRLDSIQFPDNTPADGAKPVAHD